MTRPELTNDTLCSAADSGVWTSHNFTENKMCIVVTYTCYKDWLFSTFLFNGIIFCNEINTLLESSRETNLPSFFEQPKVAF